MADVVIARRAKLLAAAILLDLVLAEPPAAIHPVVWMGRLIGTLERRAPRSGRRGQLCYGAAMVAATVGAAALTGAVVERALRRSPRASVAEAWLLKSTFAVRALLAAAEGVRRPLEGGDLPTARAALRSLVSRDTAELSPALVAAAAIESLAENLTDSALAPWLAYAVFGLPGAAAYRALNTLDSMIGYRGRYEYLGKAAARTDDLANLLPARAGALLIAPAALIGGGSPPRALATAARDHRRTESPNAGWTMAAMAGALGVRLEKAGHYQLGGGREPSAADVRRAQRVTAGALLAGAALSALLAQTVKGRGNAGPRWAARR